MTPVYTEILPAPALRDRVHRYWFLRGEADSAEAGAAPPIVPDGRPEIVFHLADPFRRFHDGIAAEQPRALFAAQIDRPLHVEPCGAVDVVGIRFRPHGAFSFVRASLDGYLNVTPALGDVAPQLARRLEEALLAAYAAPADRARALDSVLLESGPDRLDPRIGAAVEIAEQARGWIAMDAMARAAALSGRQLERAFLREVGLAPKRFARIVRFRAALRSGASGKAPWAAIAHDLGYTDQAHLVREFGEFAGVSPAAYFRSDRGLSDLLAAGDVGFRQDGDRRGA